MLKGESGIYVRYVLGEVLGVIWSDLYFIGYGFNDKMGYFLGFNKGFFFFSVYLGLGCSLCSGCILIDYEFDVKGGFFYYIFCGWYIVIGFGKIG